MPLPPFSKQQCLRAPPCMRTTARARVPFPFCVVLALPLHDFHSQACLRCKSVRGRRSMISTIQISARAEINDAHRDATVTRATRAPDRRCSHLRQRAACTDFHLKLECWKALVIFVFSGTTFSRRPCHCVHLRFPDSRNSHSDRSYQCPRTLLG